MLESHPQPSASAVDAEVLIVGAGISGIGAGIELQRQGHRSFILLEAADDLGGTWRDNTYPGVAVDIPFSSYCYAYATDYRWSRIFPTGAEIQAYVRHCAEQYGISAHIRYGATVVRARFDSAEDLWRIELASGAVLSSRFLIAATGLLSQPKLPAIAGLRTFAGKVMHTARWDHDHDLHRKRVAVIGTGASAVQIVPEIAGSVENLSVFQRTPIWISPRPDIALPPRLQFCLHRFAILRHLLRAATESGIEALTFAIVNYRRLPFIVRGVQACARWYMRRALRATDLEDKLIPDYQLGCKRPSTSNTYLKTFRRPNVALVTDPIDRICPEGIITTDGTLHEIDTLILATGFLTTEQGNAPSFDVIGRESTELGAFWQDRRLQAYRGVAVPGFPNFFLTAGPYSGGFNWFTMLEANLKHILRVLNRAREAGVTRVEVRLEAHQDYMAELWRRAEGTVFKSGACETARSYYLDRRGDAALPLPRTPWSRFFGNLLAATRDYRFGDPGEPASGNPSEPDHPGATASSGE